MAAFPSALRSNGRLSSKQSSVPEAHEVLRIGDRALHGVRTALALLLVVEAGHNLAGRAQDAYAILRPVYEDLCHGVVPGFERRIVLGDVVLVAAKPKTARGRLAGLDDGLEASSLINRH